MCVYVIASEYVLYRNGRSLSWWALGREFDILNALCYNHHASKYLVQKVFCCVNPSTGWPNKNRTFFEIPYFCSQYRYSIIIWFLLKCSEITAENNKRKFFKRVC